MNTRFRKQQTNEGGKGGGGGGAPPPGGGAPPGGGDGGAPAAAWYGNEAHKPLIESKGFKSIDDVITWGTNAEKLIGADRAGRTLVMPKDDKDVEGIKAFRQKLGVPEKAEDYGLPVPEGQDDGFAKLASSWLHEIGVPKDMGQKVAGKWNEHIAKLVADSDAAIKADSDKQLDALKTEWGGEFDQNSEFARRFAAAAGWDKAKIERYEQAFGTATMLKDLHGLGKKLGEAGFTPSDGQGGGGVSPAQAVQKIEQLKADRLSEKITQKEFLAEMDKYGPLAEKAA